MTTLEIMGLVVAALCALGGGAWRIRELERSILRDVERKLETGFQSMRVELNKKSDRAVVDAVCQNIHGSVSRIETTVTSFVARQDKRDHELEERVRRLEIHAAQSNA